MVKKSIPYSVERKNLEIFKICIIIYPDKHTFMSFDVLGEYVKILFVSSPCTHRFFPCILRIRLNTFCI
jgi:hypothetical protein